MRITTERVSFRPLTNLDDDLVFESLQDWPADDNGPFTRKRASETVHNGLMENAEAQWPLDDNSDFHYTFVVETAGEAVGVTQLRIWGKAVFVNWLALKPSARGRKVLSHACWLYVYLVFEIYQGNSVAHVAFKDSEALEKLHKILGGKVGRPNPKRYPRRTKGGSLVKHNYTRADYESGNAYVLPDGSEVLPRWIA